MRVRLAGLACLLSSLGVFAAAAAERELEPFDSPAAYVQPTRFEMGGRREGYHRNSYPRHWVTLTRPYFLESFEVTVGEFETFVMATGHVTLAEVEIEADADPGGGPDDAERTPGVWWAAPGYEQDSDWPVTCVAFPDALRYANWRSRSEGLTPAYRFSGGGFAWDREADGYRLPTEAEWELAARCGGECTVPTADPLGAFGPVGSWLPNELGIHGLLDGALEWCWDGFELYTTESRIDPVGQDPEGRRVIRGESTYRREWASEHYHSSSLGFRLARNAPAVPDSAGSGSLDPARRAELLGLLAAQDALARDLRRQFAEATLADSLVTVARAKRQTTRKVGTNVSFLGLATALLGGIAAENASAEGEAGAEDPDAVKSAETLALVGLGVAVIGGIVYLAAGTDSDADYDEALRKARVILSQRSIDGDPAVGVLLEF